MTNDQKQKHIHLRDFQLQDMQFLVPLFNFVLCGDGELECNSLSCTLPPIKFDYESSDASDSPKESGEDPHKLRFSLELG